MTVQRAIATLAAEGSWCPARAGHVRRGAAGARPAPDLAWQAVALGAARGRRRRARRAAAHAAAGRARAVLRLPARRLQPIAALAAALARAGRGAPARGTAMPLEGLARAARLVRARGGRRCDARRRLICPGGQAALVTAVRGLAAPGDAVLVESPTYLGALAAARAAGLRAGPRPQRRATACGPELLADALTRTGARVFYCQPLYANPHGATLARGAPRRGARGACATRARS